MKKIIPAIVAAVAALFVVSCQKEDALTGEYTFNLSVAEKPSLDPDTKAVRTSWQNGDEIVLSFADAACQAQGKYLKFTYNGSAWSLAADSPSSDFISSLATSGKCGAIASTSGNLTYNSYWEQGVAKWHVFDCHKHDEVLLASEAAYSLSEGTVSVSLTFSHYDNYCQVTVKGIDDSWTVSGDKLMKQGSPQIQVYYGRAIVSTPNSNMGVAMSTVTCSGDDWSGAKCYGINSWSENADMTFTLTHSTYGTWTKTFAGKGEAGKQAIIFQGPAGLTGSETTGAVVDGWTKQ